MDQVLAQRTQPARRGRPTSGGGADSAAAAPPAPEVEYYVKWKDLEHNQVCVGGEAAL